MPYKTTLPPCIYLIRFPDNKIYIGATRDLNERRRSHRSNAKRYESPLALNIKKFGLSINMMEVLYQFPFDVDSQTIGIYEEVYIEQYQSCVTKYPNSNGLNRAVGAGSKGAYWTDEQKRRQCMLMAKLEPKIKRKKGDNHPLYGKKGEQAVNYGRKHTDKSKIKIGLTQIGGKHHAAKKVRHIPTGKVFDCIKDASVEFNVTYKNLSKRIILGRTKEFEVINN